MSMTQKQQQTTHQPGEKGKRSGRPVRQTANPQQVLEAPDTLQPGELLAAQRQYGNQVVQRAVDGNRRRGEGLTDEQGNLHSHISDTIQQERGGGSPLPKTLQSEMAQGLGHDFSSVRIHTGGKADVLSRKIHARAFTIGSDIFFRGGVFAPETSRGRETLIHELTHVVQQASSGRSTSGRLKLGAAGNSLEQQAERTAQRLNKPAAAVGFAGAAVVGAVQKQAGDEEEIQTQGEEEEIQTQGEEEEVQTQPMDEEEIQTQGEEEEIQTEPDSGPVVQRVFNPLDWIKKKVKRTAAASPAAPVSQALQVSHAPEQLGSAAQAGPLPHAGALPKRYTPQMAHQVAQAVSAMKPKALFKHFRMLRGKGKTPATVSSTAKAPAEETPVVPAMIGQGVKPLAIKAPGEDTDAKPAGKPSVAEAKDKEKNRLLGVIRNTGSSAEDVQAAEEKLRMLHKRKIGVNVANSALDERKNALKEAARQGDQKAFDQLKAEKAKGMMPNKWQRFKKFASGKASTIGGVLSDVGGVVSKVKGAVMGSPIGNNIQAGMTQFMGGSKEKEKSDGGGGGGGGGALEQLVVMLSQKVQKLEADLAAKK